MKSINIKFIIIFLSLIFLSCTRDNNQIVGIWQVKNEHLEARYEMIEYGGSYFGKIHYYNDGNIEYKGSNKEEDYFINDVAFKDSTYVNGYIQYPEGKTSSIHFYFIDNNNIKVTTNYDGQPYSEIWKREINGKIANYDENNSVKKQLNTIIIKPKSNKNSKEKVIEKPNDKILGIWEVKNDYYQAVYEIEKYQEKYVGKIHYYNDGSIEHKGTNKEGDYFLTDVELKDGKYINGKMYLPDGSYYDVFFSIKNADTLEAKMTVEGQPYKETWKRKSN